MPLYLFQCCSNFTPILMQSAGPSLTSADIPWSHSFSSYSIHASFEFSVFHFLYFIFFSFPYCFRNLLIPPPCFLMSARAFWHSTYVLCCFNHYLFHLVPVFIYIQVFALFFIYLVSNHAFICFTSLFLLEFSYTYSWLELLMSPFCCIKPHVHY